MPERVGAGEEEREEGGMSFMSDQDRISSFIGSKEIQTVEIAGRWIAAHKLICPECQRLDLCSDIATSSMPWRATCSFGHSWDVDPRPDA